MKFIEDTLPRTLVFLSLGMFALFVVVINYPVPTAGDALGAAFSGILLMYGMAALFLVDLVYLLLALILQEKRKHGDFLSLVLLFVVPLLSLFLANN